jgi:hypothetical protein
MSADSKERKLEELYQIVVDDSRQLITDHWAEIEAVARALEQKSTLEGPDIILVIEQACRKEERT